MASVRGGINTALGALLACVDNVMIPTFTYATMIIPVNGPEENDMVYGSGHGSNLDAAVYRFDLPADMKNFEAGEALRATTHTYRSDHPIFSFTGLGLDGLLVEHPADDPYAPIWRMRDIEGWVLLMGATPADNFSIHAAEKKAGRKQFTRWALSSSGIHEVSNFPGCANGFHKLDYYLQEELHRVKVKDQEWQAVRLDILLSTATHLIKEDPFALLCNDLKCGRCNLVRDAVKAQYAGDWRSET